MRINFSYERETKNTVRFQEDADDQPEGHPGADVVGTLYVQKFAWAQLGKPEHIVVELSAITTDEQPAEVPAEGPGT